MEPTSPEFLRETLRTVVLGQLAEQGRMYGYEMTQSVKEQTQGELILTFGALYPVLHKLEQDGLLVTDSVDVDGRLRKYYSLRPNGNETAPHRVTGFNRFVRLIRTRLTAPSDSTIGT